MRKKNLILLTSITGLLLSMTPSQALALEDPNTISQSSSDKKDDNIRLASEDKCHWSNEFPVPENKYLKLLYDAAVKDTDFYINERLGGMTYDLKDAVDNGKISEKEAQYRMELFREIDIRINFSSYLHSAIQYPFTEGVIDSIINNVYDDPDNYDEIEKEVAEDYSLKEFLEYVDKYSTPDIHGLYVNKELRDKYQKEFDELDKSIDYDKNDNNINYISSDINKIQQEELDKFTVNKLLDGFDSEKDQIIRFIQVKNWLKVFTVKEEEEANSKKITGITYYLANDIPELHKLIKDKNLDNNEDFYKDMKQYLLDNREYGNDYGPLSRNLEKYGIKWYSMGSDKVDDITFFNYIKPTIENPDIEIPYYVVCDDEETPGEDTDTDTPTNPETPDNPGDKETTTPTTKTTNKKDKPSNKTSTKSNDKTIEETTPIKDKEEEDITTPANSETPTTPNQVKTPGKVNTPNTLNTPGQEFIPVKNTKPGTFTSGVSSSVDGEEVSEGSKVDTGSPTTNLLNKIRTIF